MKNFDIKIAGQGTTTIRNCSKLTAINDNGRSCYLFENEEGEPLGYIPISLIEELTEF